VQLRIARQAECLSFPENKRVHSVQTAAPKFNPAFADSCRLAARQATKTGGFELWRYVWGDKREATFTPARSYLELTGVRAQGCCLPHDGEMIEQGRLRFYSSAHTFYSHWFDRTQASLYCVIDVPRLSGVDFDTDGRRRQEMLNIRNDYLVSTLIRVRHELLTRSEETPLLLESFQAIITRELVRHFSAPNAHYRMRGEPMDGEYVYQLGRRLREERFQVDLATLSKEFGVTPRHFARLFRDATGLQLTSFVRRNFIQAATDLLSDKRILIKEVAYRCGFSGTAAFSSAFKKATGRTPNAYRTEGVQNNGKEDG
jgi:AraC family transcriptional regulator